MTTAAQHREGAVPGHSGTVQAAKQVLVLSDNDVLSRAIELNLNRRLPLNVIGLEVDPLLQATNQIEVDSADLILLIPVTAACQALLERALAALVERVGAAPVLILSDRPFPVATGCPVMEAPFPTGFQELHRQVRLALEKDCADDWAGRLGETKPGPSAVNTAAGEIL